MSDIKKKFLVNIAECHLATTFPEDNWDKDIIGMKDLDEFINDINCNNLYSCLKLLGENKRLQFSVTPPEGTNQIVIFYKIKPSVLTEENISAKVQTTLLNTPPTVALYQTLNQVYAPILAKTQNTQLQRQIAALQVDLKNEIFSHASDGNFLGSGDADSLIVVRSLQDELEYWQNVGGSSRSSITKSSSATYFKIIEPIAKEFGVIEALPISDVEDLLEGAHNMLDDLWRSKPPFAKERIINLMDIVAHESLDYGKKQMEKINVWTEEYSVVFEQLSQHVSLFQRWLTTCNQLTQIFWPNYVEHPWQDHVYEPLFLKNSCERLQEVLNIRTLHKQLVRLLTSQEQESLNASELFAPFIDLDIFHLGPNSDTQWQKARKRFEYLLKPAEQKVALKLQKQLSSVNANTRQLLYEFSRYSEIIRRPTLREILQSERLYLLTSLYDYIRQLQSQTSIEFSGLQDGKFDTPAIVKELITTRQLESRVTEIKSTSEKLLDDLQGYENLHVVVAELQLDLKKQHDELFESWTSEISAKIKNNTLSLKESDPVIQFSKNKLMKVNFAPRLVLLINEVRQLKALGYPVPENIDETSEHAKKFVRYAKTLEQIANFHNTIGDRMIISQRPMMLAGALELSKLVQEQEVVSWGDTRSVEKYVNTLKGAVEELSRQNNLLASYHYQAMDTIKALNDVDLIKEYSKWKDAIKSLQNIIGQVEEKGFQKMQTWITDIVNSLCKVLEKQYIRSMDTLHLYLPEIYADLIYRNSQLQFSPHEDVLKVKYQQQLKKFLDIPKNFYSISEQDAHIFTDMIERNKVELEKVSKHTDELFEQLRGVINHWKAWLQIGDLDITKLTVWQHWDLHFKVSKTFGQEIAKLPSTEERVGCFLIGLSRLRSDLESHNRSYWDQLVSSLKDSIAQDVVKLQNYIDPSTSVLTRHPVTLEEIAESGAAHANIIKQKPEMDSTFTEMIQKSKILMGWTREQVDSVNRLKGAWERLQSLLENHQYIIAKQMETVKTSLNIQCENINNELERFAAKWEQVKPKPHSGKIAESTMGELSKQMQAIKEKKAQWTQLVVKKNKLTEEYQKYSLDPPKFSNLEDLESDINKEEENWKLFGEFQKDFEKLRMEEWIVFRKKIYKFEEFLNDWYSKLKNLDHNDLVVRMLQEIDKNQSVFPCLKYVKGEDFTDKHWMTLFHILGIRDKRLDQLILKDFLSVSNKLVERVKDLQALCKRAASEIIVRQALAELDQWDVQSKFILTEHRDSKGKTLNLIKDFKEILNQIGDNQSLLQSVKNSADYENFSERAGLWEVKLVDLDYFLTSLLQIQRKWVYLEPIFGSGTLVHEKTRFEKLDKDFRYLMIYIENDPRVSVLNRYPNLRTLLENLSDHLSRCQHSLDKFLTEKRNKFPRFLFLGDDDLLEVVGQASKEHVIQSHLKKLFAGINNIKLDSGGINIVSICSLQGEVVNLTNPVNILKPVEEWLNTLVREMQITLKDLLVQCLSEGQSPDPLKYPSQILCLADNITFTLKCEQAISTMTLPPLLAAYKAQLAHYSSLELENENDGNLISLSISDIDDSNVLELKLKALLLDTIHHIVVLEELLDTNITKINEWVWQKQLRFYSNSLGEVTLKMANARMEYAYEYLGNQPKLVRTPLTDQCFLTLTQGMHLGMGGNPYGPAGTGKTESIKALGTLLGRQVLVFNCDEGIDAASMGRILSGLVRSGAWGCFDEFNRLDEATLSAISMQIHPIQVALRTHEKKVVLLEQEIEINKHCGIFVTLNPAGGSYGGRNKLPDNLKQLFRPIVMTHPDHEQIARSLLHCDGYKNADVIARKLVEVFSLAGKILNTQQHYDWGLRAIRTVLTGCGKAIKQYYRSSEKKDHDLYTELGIVVQVLRMDTLSKLTFSDSVKLDAIIKDIFKGINIEKMGNDTFVQKLTESSSEMNIKINNRQIEKCLELYEQLKQRMGVAIVGPAGSGKSTIRNLLFKALVAMGKTMKQQVFNPKSITKTQLLGEIDSDTRQWNDGILTLYSLNVTSEPLDVWSWIVCDGDIDPEWVESLNSVMDDNRLLTLPSGWRIQFGPNVNFIFETHDLSNASPATISRMGIVLLSEEDLNLNDYINSFVQSQSEHVARVIDPLVQDYFLKGVNWILNEGETTVPSSKLSIVRTGLSQLKGVRNRHQFAVTLINGLGEQLPNDFREPFAQQVFEWLNETPPPIILRARYNKERDMVDAYYTNPNLTIEDVSKGLPLIQTGQIQQALDIMRLWFAPNNEQHFLIVGPHGSAKTLIVHHLVKERPNMDIITIHCGANLKPSFVINKISQHCIMVNTNRGKVFRPKKGNLVLHFKNIHLLKSDKWDTNILIEFLHQLVTYRAFLDDSLEMVGLENFVLIGSLIATNSLSTRFISVMHVFNIDEPEQEDLSVIVLAYLSGVLKQLLPPSTSWPKAKYSKLAATMISTFVRIKSSFSPVQQKHYIFSSHDLIKWCESLLRYAEDVNEENLDSLLPQIIYYEALEILGNKLTHINDLNVLKDILNSNFQSIWGKSNILQNIDGHFHVPLSRTSAPLHDIPLTVIKTDEWTSLVNKAITQYEREGHNLKLIVTNDLLTLSASVSKALTCNGGNLILIGRAGIGRKSVVRITSAMQTVKLIIPTTNCQPQFNNDLKSSMHSAGVEGEQIYLLLEDHILNKENILSTINTLMSSGEAPGLFSNAELESLVSTLKEEASRENFEDNLFYYFTKRVKRWLHVIICLDSDNEEVEHLFDSCPAFLHNSTIIWRTNYSPECVTTLPKMMISRFSEANSKTHQIENCQHFPHIFQMASSKNPAPIRYIAMVKLYIDLFIDKILDADARQAKLKAGVAKLTEARNLVDVLKQKAKEQQIKLEEKQAKANVALDMISNTMKNANTHKEEMESLKMKTEEENQQLTKRKMEIETELAEVEPLIQEARSAVGNIKPESLSEIRSLRAPPDVIRDILEGVLRLMGIHDTSWNSMKTFLAKRGVKEDIRYFDAKRISPESRAAVERLISIKADSFDPKSAKRASVAAAPLAAWVIANVKYSLVMDKIRPLEREQNKLKKNLTNAETQLGELSAGLSDVDATVAQLKVQLSAFTKEAAEIEIDLTKAQHTLQSAEGLVEKLNDEFERWQRQLGEISNQMNQLPLNCLLASAFITYLCDDSEKERRNFMDKCLKTLGIEKFNLEDFLSSERQQIQWHSEGLSSDKLSIQNAIIALKTNLVPLLVDPTSKAIDWLAKHFGHKQVERITQNSPKFVTTLELSVRFGKILFVEEVESVSPILLSILRREYIQQGERKLICLNGKFVDYNNEFKLILCSRNEHLKLPGVFGALLTQMNFTVTEAGLTEQLLYDAIRQENPQLEEKRRQLLKEREDLQEKQYNLQNQLLEDLANCSGDILQNSSLLTSLNQTKSSSVAIAKAILDSAEVQSKLQKEYDVYYEISHFGTSLYFAINEFSKLNVLYTLSVSAFTRLFLKSLDTFQAFQKDTEHQRNHLLVSVYQFMTRGIFKKDRMKFALHLVQKMFSKNMDPQGWDVFLGNAVSNMKTDLENMPPWLPKHSVMNAQNIQMVLPDLYKSLKLDEPMFWSNFMNEDKCEARFPSHCQLGEFQKVLVVQALRPDRLYSAIKQYILNTTGFKKLDPAVLDLKHIFKESISSEPILIITTSGTDPSVEIRDLASSTIGNEHYKEIAMGEGQENKALEALHEAVKLGQWLILKNLHLVTKWLPILSQNLQNLHEHKNFRLWLVTEAHPNFSFVLSQNCFKIVYESPQGLRNNLLRTYSSWGAQYINKLGGTPGKIFFVLSCIYAALQERRTYIPQGWSKWYDFSDVDFSTCVKLVEDLWQNNSLPVPWKYIHGLCSSAVYGGRIENINDMKILETYLKSYLADDILSHRWKPFGLTSSLPSASKFEEYQNLILQIPNNEPPSFYGLPENIERAWEKQTSSLIIQDLKNLYLSKSTVKTFSLEVWQKNLTPFISLWKKLNQGYDFVKLQLPDVSDDSPLEAFITEEYYNAIVLVQEIHKHFAMLNKICKGTLTPNKRAVEIGEALLNFQTPKLWLHLWHGPNDPSKYLRSIMIKLINVYKWNHEDMNSLLRKPLSLSNMFHPEAFLVSYKLQISREIGISADQLILDTAWKQNVFGSSLIITELLIEGALFDGFSLTPCTSNSENINHVPNCLLSWKENQKGNLETEKSIYVPLYLTSSRETLLTYLKVSCDIREKDRWIQAGVAFYLEY